MKLLTALIPFLLVVACAPVTSIPNAVTRIDFSLDGTPNADSDNWVYANLKTVNPTFGGSGAVPDDRKSLVMVFNLDSKGASQLSCVVPLGAGLGSDSKGQGASFINDRKTANFSCGLSKIK
jgi:hypothetical protein